MPWCPKCKCEYKAGITECADCKVPLVDELPKEDFKEVQDIPVYEVPSESEMASEDGEKRPTSAGIYQDKKAKAEDFKSSAYTLLVVGVLGIVALILIECNVLPIQLVAPGKYITYGVMGAMFTIFIIMGISSFRSSKKYEGEAKAEDDLTNEIKDWATQNITQDYIKENVAIEEEGASIEDIPQEMQYFYYYAVIKNAITGQFGELEATYLDALCEEIYGMVFDK